MANRKTQAAGQFRKSVGAGFQSLMGAKGRTYFVLEFKTPTDKYPAGKSITFTSDYVEMGRDPKAALNFSPNSVYVSRKHAAVQREGDKYVLKQLSQTNPTLINGKPVANQFYLNNGDEIQLSLEGPKIGFLAPANNTAKSLPLSVRLNSFRREALKPYKTALIISSLFFLTAIGGLGYFLFDTTQKLDVTNTELHTTKEDLNTTKEDLEKTKQQNKALAESFAAKKKADKNEIARMKKKTEKERQEYLRMMEQQKIIFDKYKEDQKAILDSIAAERPNVPTDTPSGSGPVALVNANQKDTYIIVVESAVFSADIPEKQLELVNKEILGSYKWSGTGFLLEDGRFISARHVIHPWYYISSAEDPNLFVNALLHNFPNASLVINFAAKSPSGKIIRFKSTDFKSGKELDEAMEIEGLMGEGKSIVKVAKLGYSDWASAKLGMTGDIKIGNELSQNLKAGTKIYVLGYPIPGLMNDLSDLKTVYSESSIAQDGLVNNIINITNRGFDQGNSGGPAFVVDGGVAKVVGIVSAQSGASAGFLVPIFNAE